MDQSAQFFKDADTLSVEALGAWFADDIKVRFGNQPVLEGKSVALESFRSFYQTINAMNHQREWTVQEGGSVTSHAIVTYTRNDGHTVSMPVASGMHFNAGGKVDKLFIYIDMAPLFAAA